MKYISALFIILLIFIPISLAQSEVMEMIEKSPEGKEVLDSIFLQASIEGPNIDIGEVKIRLKVLENQTRKMNAYVTKKDKEDKKRCNNHLNLVNARFHDFTSKALYARRALDHAGRSQQRRARWLQRASQELRYYTKFRSMIRESSKKWEKFWKAGRRNYNKIVALVSQIRAHLRKFHKQINSNANAFIELPPTFSNAMTEIASQFENTYDEFGGLRPVIANLLEVLKSPEHFKNPKARAAMRNVLSKLAYKLRSQLEVIDEENEHQKAVFSSLLSLFDDAVKNSSRVLNALGTNAKRSNKKLQFLKNTFSEATSLASKARDITSMVSQECKFDQAYNRKVAKRCKKFLLYVEQDEEVIADRWQTLRSFIVERLEKVKLKNEIEDKDNSV